MHNHLRSPDKTRTLSAEAALAAAVFILAGIGGAFLMTLGGVQWLMDQLALAGDFKSELITTVLGLGMVILGPILLLAVAVILPPWWFRSLWRRLRGLVLGGART
jgi:hypothetical protein